MSGIERFQYKNKTIIILGDLINYFQNQERDIVDKLYNNIASYSGTLIQLPELKTFLLL